MYFKKRMTGLCLIIGTMFLLAGCGTTVAGQKSTIDEFAAEEKKLEPDTVLSAEKSNDTDSTLVTAEKQTVIKLSADKVEINGTEIEEFNYIWNISPEKEKAWYEGTEPETGNVAYIAHDIWYYPELDENAFSKQNYDGETEWVYHYTGEGLTDYIFSTLPVQGEGVPIEMMHSAEEAYDNPVLHIIAPGTYVLEGEWHGQIMVDLGDKDEKFTDENAKVTLILNGVDITCDCGPGVLFYSAYECDNAWEEAESYSGKVDTKDAGANVIIADGTVNNVAGTNVYRILKPEYKKNSDTVQKKAYKIDGAFYSFVSMNITGGESGILNITSGFEGLDSELHLTVNGGLINIYSQNDAVNVNEDNVSVFTMNDGVMHIFAGLGAEGDGIDSNGFITINGGTIAGGTPSGADSLLDADCEIVENGNIIVIGSNRPTGFMHEGGRFEGMTPPDGFEMPEGMTPPEGFEMHEGMTPPDGFGKPDGRMSGDGQERPEKMEPPAWNTEENDVQN